MINQLCYFYLRRKLLSWYLHDCYVRKEHDWNDVDRGKSGTIRETFVVVRLCAPQIPCGKEWKQSLYFIFFTTVKKFLKMGLVIGYRFPKAPIWTHLHNIIFKWSYVKNLLGKVSFNKPKEKYLRNFISFKLRSHNFLWWEHKKRIIAVIWLF